ncbi:MAG: tetratricopeptide repeat protein [Pseudomonadota bacterium]|nr:tetratricopeptide repeat protein [Pseudomonadota bacterium]
MKLRRRFLGTVLVSALVDVGAAVQPWNALTAAAESKSARISMEPAASAVSRAVAALLRLARSQGEAGHGEQAAATLERALRIEPRNPWLWHRLAVLRLQQGYSDRAAELAKKSNLLARDHRRLLTGNLEVIQAARARISRSNEE